MNTKTRISKLEDVERVRIIQQIESLERQVSERMTEAQLFAVNVAQLMRSTSLRNLADEDLRKTLAQHRKSASLAKLQNDIKALQWANEQFEKYESENEQTSAKENHHIN